MWQDLEREQGIEAALRQRLAILEAHVAPCDAAQRELWQLIKPYGVPVPEKNDRFDLIIYIYTHRIIYMIYNCIGMYIYIYAQNIYDP